MSDTRAAREEARTGVGTPDARAQAAGAALGGDTGDVGTPRDTIGVDQGGTAGTTSHPEGSTVWEPGGLTTHDKLERQRRTA